MYTDRGAASSQCEPQFDTYLPAPALRARAASHPWGENLSIQTGSARLGPRVWAAPARLGETPYLVARVGLNRAVPLQVAGSGVEFGSGGPLRAL